MAEAINYRATPLQLAIVKMVQLAKEVHGHVFTMEEVVTIADEDKDVTADEVRDAYRIMRILGFIPMPPVTDEGIKHAE